MHSFIYGRKQERVARNGTSFWRFSKCALMAMEMQMSEWVGKRKHNKTSLICLNRSFKSILYSKTKDYCHNLHETRCNYGLEKIFDLASLFY